MTKELRLQVENELMREFRLWYNPANISDEELRNNIDTQKEVVKIIEEAYKDREDEESAVGLLTEVMKLVIWEDILTNRDPSTRPIELED